MKIDTWDSEGVYLNIDGVSRASYVQSASYGTLICGINYGDAIA